MNIRKILLVIISIMTLNACLYEDGQTNKDDFEASSAEYSYLPASPGDEVIIDSYTYNIFKVPVINETDGDLYFITLPSTSGNNKEMHLYGAKLNSINISPNNYAPSEFVEIDGYPAITYEKCKYSASNYAEKLISTCNTDIYIKLDGMYVMIMIDGLYTEKEIPFGSDAYDLSAGIDITDVSQYGNLQHIDDFIDYIKIDKI